MTVSAIYYIRMQDRGMCENLVMWWRIDALAPIMIDRHFRVRLFERGLDI